jgi:hypothetical protein
MGIFHELAVYLHSVSCVKGWACVVCIRLNVSRARLVSAFCSLDPEPSFSAYVCIYRELLVCLFSFACIKGWARACMCLYPYQVPWVYVCVCLRVLRARHVSAYAYTYQELRVCLRVFVRVESQAFFSMVCTHWGPSVYLRVFARVENQACFRMCLHTLTAESVAACVWTYRQPLRVCLRVSMRVESLACVCIFLDLLRADYLYMLAITKKWACVRLFLHASASRYVPACVGGRCESLCVGGPVSKAERESACLSCHEGSTMIPHVLARIKSWACIWV